MLNEKIARFAQNGNRDLYDKAFSICSREEKLGESDKNRFNAAFYRELQGRTNVPFEQFETYGRRTDFRESVCEVIEFLVSSAFDSSVLGYLDNLTEVRNVGWGVNERFTAEPQNLLTVTKSGLQNRQTDIQTLNGREFTITPELHKITVGIRYWDILRGIASPFDIINKAISAMRRAMSEDVADAFIGALSALPTPYGITMAGGFDAEDALEIAANVGTRNGGEDDAIFLGTRSALAKAFPNVSDYIQYHYSDERIETGYFKAISGYPLVRLNQTNIRGESWGLKFPKNDIYVISNNGVDKPVKVVIEGNPVSILRPAEDNADLMTVFTLMKSWGVGIVTSQFAGRITLA